MTTCNGTDYNTFDTVTDVTTIPSDDNGRKREPLREIINRRITRANASELGSDVNDVEKVTRRRSARLASFDKEIKDDNILQKCNGSKEYTSTRTHTTETLQTTKSQNGVTRHDSTFVKRSRLNEHHHIEHTGEINHQTKLRAISSDEEPSSIGLTGINGARKKRSISDVNTETDESQFQTVSLTDTSDESNYNLVLNPFNNSLYTSGISEYDTPSKGKILEAPEYVSDIFQRLYHAETQHKLEPYLHTQPKINEVMRAILVDWLVEVHQKFRLEQETLYLCVNILDRYLSVVPVERKQLQLVGVTSLLLASKYEEIYPPEVKDCVYITDRAYSRQEILDMELTILDELKFNLTVPSAYPFLQRFLFITQATETMKFASCYYMDRLLQEYDYLNFRPSLLAVAVVCLAINHTEIRDYDEVRGAKPGVPKILLDYTGYSRASVIDAADFVTSKIVVQVQTVSKRNLVAVKRKYEDARHKYVSSYFDPPTVDDILE